jgi:hypothetical protein
MNSTFALAKVRQDGGEVARLLEHRPRGGADRRAKLVADDVGQRRLAQPWRPVQQNVIQRFAPLEGGGDRHLQVLADSGPGRCSRSARADEAPLRTGRLHRPSWP